MERCIPTLARAPRVAGADYWRGEDFTAAIAKRASLIQRGFSEDSATAEDAGGINNLICPHSPRPCSSALPFFLWRIGSYSLA